MDSSSTSSTGRKKIGADGRQTWDIDEYEKQLTYIGDLEEDRIKRKEVPLGIVPSAIEARTDEIDIEKAVGTIETSTENTSTASAFYCKVCEIEYNDSKAYLDHLNSVRHQAMLGNLAQTRRATITQVRDRIAYYDRRSKDEKETHLSLEEKIRLRLSTNETKFSQTQQKRQHKKRQATRLLSHMYEQDTETLEEMKALGLSVEFGTRKKAR